MEGPGAERGAERRRDRRLRPPGTVFLGPTTLVADVRGRLVDVSAGGVRARDVTGRPLAVGQLVQVEIRIGAETDTAPPPVRLAGRGHVIRVLTSEEGTEVAIRFDAPLAVRDVFPAGPEA